MDAEPPYGSQYNAGDIGFVIVSMSLVWLMIPGIGYFYSGLARSKNALSMIMSAFLCLVVVSVQVRLFTYFDIKIDFELIFLYQKREGI